VAGEVTDVPVQANVPLKEGEILFSINPTPYEAQIRQVEAQLNLAQINLERARELEKRQAGTLAILQQREAEVDQLTAQLDAVRWNLDKTTARAPSDDFVTNVGLRKGARVTAFPMAAVMAFIETDETVIGVQIHQIYARHIAPGQAVEPAFKYLPGQILNARVVSLLPATAIGQGLASGSALQAINIQPVPFGVRVELENPEVATQIPAGSTGETAIYTDSVTMTHLIRRVMIRMSSYLNYILPF
jgi:multidrug resistance efflux pump